MFDIASDIRISGTRKLSVGDVVRLPRYITGSLPDVHSWGRMFKNYFAYALIDRIHSAFLQKSDGQADETGLKWKPLKRETIAQRPMQPGEWKKHGIMNLGRGGRGLLTLLQNKLWKGIFFSTYKRLLLKVGDAEAKRIAARTAWAILKSMGAKTKLETLGDRKVPILRVSDRLMNSLAPGSLSGAEYIAPTEQVYQRHWGSITIGSKVPYAAKQHNTRPLWPSFAAMKRAGWLGKCSKWAISMLTNQIGA